MSINFALYAVQRNNHTIMVILIIATTLLYEGNENNAHRTNECDHNLNHQISESESCLPLGEVLKIKKAIEQRQEKGVLIEVKEKEQEIAKKQEEENLNVTVGDQQIPFEVVTEPTNTGIKGFEFEGNVSFKEENPEILNTNEIEPEVDSAGFSIEDREETKQENEQ